MNNHHQSELPDDTLWAARFASQIVKAYSMKGGNIADLFTAFAGVVSARNRAVAADSLLAIEEAINKQSS